MASTRMGPRFLVCLLGWMGVVWASTDARAGRDPEPWDHLPPIVEMVFSPTEVGLLTAQGHPFLLDRRTRRLSQVDPNRFHESFPGQHRLESASLAASNGRVFRAKDAYCSEGQQITHALYESGQRIADRVDPCTSVSAVEIVGEQLWLGTRRDGEYGEYPAQGVVVQSLEDESAIGQIGTEAGLSGGLVRVIRLDPHSESVWIATESGIDEVDRKLRVVDSWYLYEDFDSTSGRTRIFASPVPRRSDVLAGLARQLELPAPAFYREVLELEPGLRDAANERGFLPDGHFAPTEMNRLVPLILERARASSPPSSASYALCGFDDPRARAFFEELQEDELEREHVRRYAKRCLDRFARHAVAAKPSPKAPADPLSRALSAATAPLEVLPGPPPGDAVQDCPFSFELLGVTSGNPRILAVRASEQERLSALWEVPAGLAPWGARDGVQPTRFEGVGLEALLTEEPALGGPWFFSTDEFLNDPLTLTSVIRRRLPINGEIHITLEFELPHPTPVELRGLLSSPALSDYRSVPVRHQEDDPRVKLARSGLGTAETHASGPAQVERIVRLGDRAWLPEWSSSPLRSRALLLVSGRPVAVDGAPLVWEEPDGTSARVTGAFEMGDSLMFRHSLDGRYAAIDTFYALTDAGLRRCGAQVLGSD